MPKHVGRDTFLPQRGAGLSRLGHVDMKSTEVYVQADLEMKRKALESGTGPQPTQPAEALPSGLIEWLESL